MLASYNWLKEYCRIEQDAFTLAKELTSAGLEVSDIHQIFTPIQKCVVGEITAISPHPNANRLRCVEVDVGERKLDIVCGADNISEGIKVPVALVGAVLPCVKGGLTVKPSKIRGQISNGMICSKTELGLTYGNQSKDNKGIWMLPPETPIAKPIFELFPKEDFIFDFDIASNRPDCLSIIGLAREASCLNGNYLINNPLSKKFINGIQEINNVNIILQEPEKCPRYAARIIKGITIASSPEWLVSKLEMHGIRSINNVVDVTNYVLLACGQPLHAFDLDRLVGSKITIRQAQADELFDSLDGKEIKLSSKDLVIADEEKPVALAGIIGGKQSSVHAKTTSIFLECACFNPETIRDTSKRHRLETDSSIRFRRQVNIAAINQVIDYATELISKIAGGQTASGVKDVYPVKQKAKEIRFHYQEIEKRLGIAIEKVTVNNIFQNLGFSLKPIDMQTVSVTIHSARADLKHEWDLIEEIARIHGYDKIPENLPSITNSSPSINTDSGTILRHKIQGLGYNQVINLSFVENKYIENNLMDDVIDTAVKVQNPVTVDIAYLRQHLLFGLLKNVKLNLDLHINENQKMFEMGHVFERNGDNYVETNALGLLGYGSPESPNWDTPNKAYSYYDLAQDIRELWDPLHENKITFREKPCFVFSPLASAEIEYRGNVVGIAGLVNPKIAERLGIRNEKIFYAEIKIDALVFPTTHHQFKFDTVSPYPSVYRDFAIVTPFSQDTGAIISFIQRFDSRIQKVNLTNIYGGEKVDYGKISIVFNIEYQSSEGTLDKETVDAIEKKLAEQVTMRFSVNLR